jgi:hypothetical protein
MDPKHDDRASDADGEGRHVSAGDVVDPASPMRAELEQLLASKRYEEALQLLHAARWSVPDAAEISRGIGLLKERLVRGYLRRIGNLDVIPRRTGDLAGTDASFSEEERTLLRLVDGISSFGDIANQSMLGRFETYRALVRFLDDGIVAAPASSEPPAAGTGRGLRLVLPRWALPAAGALVVMIGAGVWLSLRATRPAPVTVARPAAPPAPPSPIIVVPVPDPEEAAAAAEEAPAQPAAPGVGVSRRRHPRRSRRSDPRHAAATAEADDDDDEAPTAASPAAAAALAPAPAPARPPAATRSAAPAPPAPASVSIADLTVRGPLATSVVEQGIARVEPDLRACYAGAAAAAHRGGAGGVRVQLVVDETGHAREVSAAGGPLPGLAGCVREAASRIRSRLAPDVGVARVAFTVTFTPSGS